jgi:hypothetical protein
MRRLTRFLLGCIAATALFAVSAPAAPAAAATLTCNTGIMVINCSVSGAPASSPVFLNIDLDAYSYGFNGVSDTVTNGSGAAIFPSFEVDAYLNPRGLGDLECVIMAVTNQPGDTLDRELVSLSGSGCDW